MKDGVNDPLSLQSLLKGYENASNNDPNGKLIALALIALVARVEHLIVEVRRDTVT